MKLIVNADDFGYTKSNTLGIIEGFKKGIIRSTTAMMNMPYVEFAAEQSEYVPGLGIGVHLTLTVGQPLTKCKTLVDDKGNFLSRSKLLDSNVSKDEILNEFKAQIDKFIEVFKVKPTHLDSHHGCHDLDLTKDITLKLAKEYNLPVRRYSNYKFIGNFYGESITVENLKNIILSNIDEEGIEIMTHAGFCDLELYNNSSYSLDRVKELSVLCSESIKDFIEKNKIELVHY